MKKNNTFLTLFICSIFFSYGQSGCSAIPEVNFPGGRVVMTFDGNVHDDDDILAMGYSAGLWWAAGLQDKVVQIEYNDHVCDTNTIEPDGFDAGVGDDSQNMRTTAAGLISQFGYNSNIVYDYERQGSASTAKMASEIEKSTASNPLWIIAGGPMETVWRALEKANKGFNNVTIISHSTWNENHNHCSNSHDWDDLKNKYQGKGIFFVENCTTSCNGSNDLPDQNPNLRIRTTNWYWMRDSNKTYNKWLFSRNPFGVIFDPSDAGMSYFLITGGPFKGGEKTPDHNDFRKLMENPCSEGPITTTKEPTTVAITSPNNNQTFNAGDNVTVSLSTSGTSKKVKHEVFVNGSSVDTDGSSYSTYTISSIAKGNYDIRAEVTDAAGHTATNSVQISVDQTQEAQEPENPGEPETPTSSGDANFAFLSPADGEGFSVGESILVNLAEGTGVVKYQIFVDNKLVDTDGSNFTSYKITNAAQGSYSIRAEATTSNGAKSSKTITVNVGGNPNNQEESTPPAEVPSAPTGNGAISLSVTPANGTQFTVGQNVSINLNANSSGGNIVRHLVYVNGKLVDTDGSNFTPYVISNIANGSHTIKGEVTDASGNKASSTVQITAGQGLAPTQPESPSNPVSVPSSSLAFVSPNDGERFSVGETISVNLNGGTDIVRYQIFVNNTLVDTDGSYFTPYAITNAQSGSYTIRAEATNNSGAKSSETLVVSVGGASSAKTVSSFKGSSNLASISLKASITDANTPLRIAPNPIENKVMHVYQEKSSDLRIRNFSGSLVKEIKMAGEEEQIDISSLKPGVYVLESDTEFFRFIVK